MGILKTPEEYSRYYGDFRGVDFSSDHTQVNENRFPYLVNMYKDYGSGQGKAIETVPGFRRRVNLPEETQVFGIHEFTYLDENEQTQKKILIHAGSKLYLWRNYPLSVNVLKNEMLTVTEEIDAINCVRTFNVPLPYNVDKVISLTTASGEDITINAVHDKSRSLLVVSSSQINKDELVHLEFYEGQMHISDALFVQMNAAKSTSFAFNNRLYIIDGKNYLVYDGGEVSSVLNNAYIPTTYINIIPSGENADIGVKIEQANILQPKFRHTFIPDGVTDEFYMNESDLDGISEVKLYGNIMTEGTDYTTDLSVGKIIFTTAPPKPDINIYPEFYAGLEITAKKTFRRLEKVSGRVENISNAITKCTIATTFDNRVFLSGNPAYPNLIFFCRRNSTGYVDPTYFGIYDYMQDGVTAVPITGMLTVADTLMVLKRDTRQEGSTFYHTAAETGDDLQPVIYPSNQGLSGIGCLGACINFLDDPIFVSRLGVEAIGQLSVRYERATEHRSSLIDAKLVNMDLRYASLEEWNGYLVLLCEGKIFLADSRQRYQHEIGVPQYEWYYLEDIGVYKGQYPEYRYSERMYSELENKSVEFCRGCKKAGYACECGNDDNFINIPLKAADAVYDSELAETYNLLGKVANPPDEEGKESSQIFNETITTDIEGIPYKIRLSYAVHEMLGEKNAFGKREESSYEALLCDIKGNKTGGVFKAARIVKNLDENLFFGSENGVICSFNFDMRNDDGSISSQHYSFDERTVFSGCATKMDCCGIPHLNKSTTKKSTVIKTKAFSSSAAKIKVRTNKKPYQQLARINSTLFSFANVDFSDLSFETTEQSLFAVKEKEKKWVEKQYFLYSDEYLKPFALFYISFRYYISGRYKE